MRGTCGTPGFTGANGWSRAGPLPTSGRSSRRISRRWLRRICTVRRRLWCGSRGCSGCRRTRGFVTGTSRRGRWRRGGGSSSGRTGHWPCRPRRRTCGRWRSGWCLPNRGPRWPRGSRGWWLRREATSRPGSCPLLTCCRWQGCVRWGRDTAPSRCARGREAGSRRRVRVTSARLVLSRWVAGAGRGYGAGRAGAAGNYGQRGHAGRGAARRASRPPPLGLRVLVRTGLILASAATPAARGTVRPGARKAS
jgi:hypothetical protein